MSLVNGSSGLHPQTGTNKMTLSMLISDAKCKQQQESALKDVKDKVRQKVEARGELLKKIQLQQQAYDESRSKLHEVIAENQKVLAAHKDIVLGLQVGIAELTALNSDRFAQETFAKLQLAVANMPETVSKMVVAEIEKVKVDIAKQVEREKLQQQAIPPVLTTPSVPAPIPTVSQPVFGSSMKTPLLGPKPLPPNISHNPSLPAEEKSFSFNISNISSASGNDDSKLDSDSPGKNLSWSERFKAAAQEHRKQNQPDSTTDENEENEGDEDEEYEDYDEEGEYYEEYDEEGEEEEEEEEDGEYEDYDEQEENQPQQQPFAFNPVPLPLNKPLDSASFKFSFSEAAQAVESKEPTKTFSFNLPPNDKPFSFGDLNGAIPSKPFSFGSPAQNDEPRKEFSFGVPTNDKPFTLGQPVNGSESSLAFPKFSFGGSSPEKSHNDAPVSFSFKQ